MSSEEHRETPDLPGEVRDLDRPAINRLKADLISDNIYINDEVNSSLGRAENAISSGKQYFIDVHGNVCLINPPMISWTPLGTPESLGLELPESEK